MPDELLEIYQTINERIYVIFKFCDKTDASGTLVFGSNANYNIYSTLKYSLTSNVVLYSDQKKVLVLMLKANRHSPLLMV